MQIVTDCIPCLLRQAVDASRLVGIDEVGTIRLLKRIMARLARMDLELVPPALGQQIHRIIREECGNADPYAEVKRQSTEWALEGLGNLRAKVFESERPLRAAVRYAIAGNILDFAALRNGINHSLLQSLVKADREDLDEESLELLEARLAQAGSVLIIGDNAGETVFDALLMETIIKFYPGREIHYGVKSSPVINDATREDACAAGIEPLARIVANGTDAPGTLLDQCSAEFCDLFARADLVIAKGQANYESLGDCGREVFFLTQIKCPVIARLSGHELWQWVVAVGGKNSRGGMACA